MGFVLCWSRHAFRHHHNLPADALGTMIIRSPLRIYAIDTDSAPMKRFINFNTSGRSFSSGERAVAGAEIVDGQLLASEIADVPPYGDHAVLQARPVR